MWPCKRIIDATHTIFNRGHTMLTLNNIFKCHSNPNIFMNITMRKGGHKYVHHIEERHTDQSHKHFETMLGSVKKS